MDFRLPGGSTAQTPALFKGQLCMHILNSYAIRLKLIQCSMPIILQEKSKFFLLKGSRFSTNSPAEHVLKLLDFC